MKPPVSDITAHNLIRRSIDWLIDLLIEWSIDRLIDWIDVGAYWSFPHWARSSTVQFMCKIYVLAVFDITATSTVAIYLAIGDCFDLCFIWERGRAEYSLWYVGPKGFRIIGWFVGHIGRRTNVPCNIWFPFSRTNGTYVHGVVGSMRWMTSCKMLGCSLV